MGTEDILVRFVRLGKKQNQGQEQEAGAKSGAGAGGRSRRQEQQAGAGIIGQLSFLISHLSFP
jgi:hypothetical protein